MGKARGRDVGYTRETGTGDVGRVRSIKRVLAGVLGLNLLVAFAKLGYGLLSGSVAMTADGFHSLFDGTSNVVGLVGMSLASRPADDDHPYGHGKYETFASLVIAVLLALAAWRVASSALERLVTPGEAARVDAFSFVVMLGTLAVNFGVTTYERKAGKRLGSEILVADASHTASDVLVSLGVIVGLAAVKLGFPQADPIIALVVAAFILVAGWRVLRSAQATLSDSRRIAPSALREVAMSVPGVLGAHHVRTRGPASEVYVDLHIQVDPTVSVAVGHATAELVEKTVCDRFEEVRDVIVHLEPLDEYQAKKTAAETEAEQGA